MHDSIDVVPVASSGFHTRPARATRAVRPLRCVARPPAGPRATIILSVAPPRARAGWIFAFTVFSPSSPRTRASARMKSRPTGDRTHGRRPRPTPHRRDRASRRGCATRADDDDAPDAYQARARSSVTLAAFARARRRGCRRDGRRRTGDSRWRRTGDAGVHGRPRAVDPQRPAAEREAPGMMAREKTRPGGPPPGGAGTYRACFSTRRASSLVSIVPTSAEPSSASSSTPRVSGMRKTPALS